MSGHGEHHGFQGPKSWAAAAVLGALVGGGISLVSAVESTAHPTIELWKVAPFVTLLACIALMPFISARFWHERYPEIALFLGMLVAAFYIVSFRTAGPGHSTPYGLEKVLHAAEEYASFIALVGGLYVVSGGILIEVRGRCTTVANVALLGVGAVLANVVGTTGASMLLIRPFMRLNSGRLSPLHIVLFIFIVSNCGGCLTPIGDPPLYLGFLKGVPFEWTIIQMWPDWLFTIGALLAVSAVIDIWIGNYPEWTEPRIGPAVVVRGRTGFVCLLLMLVGVFIAPVLKAVAHMDGLLIGAAFQVGVATSSYLMAPKDILRKNAFTFEPVKEVGLIFAGIFLTMIPALGYLAAQSSSLGIKSSLGYYFGTGSLSAVLDNAPTYLSFLQVAFGPEEVNAAGLKTFLSTPQGVHTLSAISTGAVFFGAMTYIGNGPNFMVKAIAEASGVRMPGFFGYLTRACIILLPILIVHAVLFIR